MTLILVLGAPDPEMTLIETLAEQAGVRVVHATHKGARVNSRTAYQVDGVEPSILETPEFEGIPEMGYHLLLVECDGEYLHTLHHYNAGPLSVTVADHHRPGDRGYGRPAAEFLPGSSVGQVIALLGDRGINPFPEEPRVAAARGAETGVWRSAPGVWQVVVRRDGGADHVRVPNHVLLAAAADHCLHAAYRGECPGVDPDGLMAWRIETRAAHQCRSASAVLADIEAARRALRLASWCDACGSGGRLSGSPDCPHCQGSPALPHFSPSLPELQEAAAREGLPFTALLGDKTVLQGADPDTIRWWMADQEAAGLTVYGDPVRGFAGTA